MGYHQVYKPIHNCNSKRKRKREKAKRIKDLEEIIGKHFLNLMKTMNKYTKEDQQIPNRIISKRPMLGHTLIKLLKP
jgi:hypothetical protein